MLVTLTQDTFPLVCSCNTLDLMSHALDLMSQWLDTTELLSFKISCYTVYNIIAIHI